jgi:hypothetical protein
MKDSKLIKVHTFMVQNHNQPLPKGRRSIKNNSIIKEDLHLGINNKEGEVRIINHIIDLQ